MLEFVHGHFTLIESPVVPLDIFLFESVQGVLSDRLSWDREVPAEALVAGRLRVSSHVGPHLRRHRSRLREDFLKVERWIFLLEVSHPREEWTIFLADVEHDRESRCVLLAPNGTSQGIIHHDLHLEIPLLALDRVLRGILKTNLVGLPPDLHTSRERFDSVEGAQGAISDVHSEGVVAEAVVGDLSLFPGCQER